MKLLGLTGSVGMGKSTTAAMFADLGAPVFDADAEVHKLYAQGGGAVAPLVEAFGDILATDGGVDRAKLRTKVLGNPDSMQRLESIVHPLTARAQVDFRGRHEAAAYAVLDIPLLFEVGSHKICDYVAVVSAPLAMQRARVLARDGMTEAVFQSILTKQMPDAEKRAGADFILSTAFGQAFTRQHVGLIDALLQLDID